MLPERLSLSVRQAEPLPERAIFSQLLTAWTTALRRGRSRRVTDGRRQNAKNSKHGRANLLFRIRGASSASGAEPADPEKQVRC
jgi:hypothetical protein